MGDPLLHYPPRCNPQYEAEDEIAYDIAYCEHRMEQLALEANDWAERAWECENDLRIADAEDAVTRSENTWKRWRAIKDQLIELETGW